MDFFQLLLLAIVLGIDSFLGLFSLSGCGNARRGFFFKTSLVIGLFHFGMPLLGEYLTSFVIDRIADYAGYISAAVFCFLGIKMIKESVMDENPKIKFTLVGMLLFAYLLSIDALATGFSISLLGYESLLIPSMLFAVVSFAMAYIGSVLGRRCSTWNSRLTYIIGGVLLFALGVKTLFDSI